MNIMLFEDDHNRDDECIWLAHVKGASSVMQAIASSDGSRFDRERWRRPMLASSYEEEHPSIVGGIDQITDQRHCRVSSRSKASRLEPDFPR